MKKLLLALITLIMLCAFALTASAFDDVKDGAWYYDAVTETVEKGIFSGMSENSFKPNAKMTRAMFVTTLAKTVGAEVGEYTGTPFTDVKAGDWFAPYVEWAYKNGITSGISEDKFGVNNSITREQMVTLFYNTAKKFSQDVSITDTYKYNKVFDKKDIDTWASEAIRWAMQNSIISGSSTVGTSIIVDPNGTATRAQAAQIIVKYLEFLEKDLPHVTGLTINGNPIESYTIVYSENVEYPKNMKKAANALQGYIKDATGVTLPVVTDTTEPTGLELIVGLTNREDKGIVKADRDGEDRCSFEISVQGNNLLIAGKSYGENEQGTMYGVYAFAEEILGFEFYTEDIRVNKKLRDVDIADGYLFKDGPGFEYRVVYWGGVVSSELSTGEPQIRYGLAHNLSEFIGFGDATTDNPCLTNPEYIATIKDNFYKTVEARPELEAIWFSQNDSNKHCLCDECKAVYREEGSRAGTIMRLCNQLCETVEPINPDLEIWTLAYLYTANPVRSTLDEDVVVYFCTIQNCASHTYNDPSCPQNRSLYNNVVGWNAVCDKLYVWDYSTNFNYSLCPMPIATALRENKSFFYDMGVRGEFNNAIADTSGEFGSMKAYLLAELQWDPKMTKEEYRTKLEKFMDAYYGPGGKYILEYVDITEELSDKNCFSYQTSPEAVIDHETTREVADKLNALWDKAEALCENQEQYDRIRRSRISWTYMYLDAIHEVLYTNGDAASRALYAQMATDFYNETVKYDVTWTERNNTPAFDTTKSPVEWARKS